MFTKQIPAGRIIAVANTLAVLTSLLLYTFLFENDFVMVWLDLPSRLLRLANFPVYFLADFVPQIVFYKQIPGVILNVLVFTLGPYFWARLVCLMLHVDRLDIQMQPKEGTETKPTEEQ
ncbi:MAG: hypothetical protein AAF797_05545 [Planctomycetota bacterium]